MATLWAPSGLRETPRSAMRSLRLTASASPASKPMRTAQILVRKCEWRTDKETRPQGLALLTNSGQAGQKCPATRGAEDRRAEAYLASTLKRDDLSATK